MRTDKISGYNYSRGWFTMLAFMAVLATGCGEQGLSVDTEKVIEQDAAPLLKEASLDSVQYYFNQARLGIGDAYVKMAQYHLDGTLGKPNLLNIMTMGFMAEEYMAIPNMKTLFKDVPDSDVTKITFLALEMLNYVEEEDTLQPKADGLLAQGIAEGYFIKAMIAYKKGDNSEAIALCEKAREGGSVIADIFKDIFLSGMEYGSDLQPETLLKIADRFPMAYRLLGDYYAKIPNDSVIDIPLAAQYYRKASEQACLGRCEAQWMLSAIAQNWINAMDSVEIRRLCSLSRNEINDSVIWLP